VHQVSICFLSPPLIPHLPTLSYPFPLIPCLPTLSHPFKESHIWNNASTMKTLLHGQQCHYNEERHAQLTKANFPLHGYLGGSKVTAIKNHDEVYNVWCDKLAQNWPFTDPQVTPQEKWALFSSYPESHKVIEDLGKEFHSITTYSIMAHYLHTQHDLSNAKIGKINLYALHTLFQHLSIHKWANTVKMMHDWIPTYSTYATRDVSLHPFALDVASLLEHQVTFWYVMTHLQLVINHYIYNNSYLHWWKFTHQFISWHYSNIIYPYYLTFPEHLYHLPNTICS